MSIKLKQSVEAKELDASALIHLFTRYLSKDLLHRPLRSLIAIADRILNQVSLSVNQSIINAPAINSNAFDWQAKFERSLPCYSDADLYLTKDAGQAPTKMAVYLDWRIMKAVHFFQELFTEAATTKK